MTSTSWTGGTGDWGDGAHWSDGVPDAPDADATIAAAGTYTVGIGFDESFTVGSAVLNAAGATLEVHGALDLAGTLSLDAGTFDLAAAGVIHGGTIVIGAATTLFDHGVLDGVQVIGPLHLAAAFSWLTITHGLNVTPTSGGRGLITLDGDFSVLDFQGTQSFDHARISLGGATGFNGGFILDTGTLTLGSHVTVVSSIDRARATIGGATVINDGAIRSRAHFGFFKIDPKAFTNNGAIIAGGRQSLLVADGKSFINGLTGTIEVKATDRVIVGGAGSTFENQGSMVVEAGGELTLAGTYSLAGLGAIDNRGQLDLAGLLLNQGTTAEFGAGALSGKVVFGGTIHGGVVMVDRGADVALRGTLDGVTFRGPLNLVGEFSGLLVQNGLAVTRADGQGPGRVNLDGANTTLFFVGSQGFDDATVHMGHTPGDGVFADIMRLRVPIHTAATLTLGAGLRIVSNIAGAQARIDQEANRAIDGTIINDGLIRAAAAGGQFDIAPDHFINNGRIQVRSTDHLVIGLFGSFTNDGRLRAAAGSSVLFNAGGFSSFDNTGKIVIRQGATLDVTGVYTPASLGDVRVRGTFILDGLIDNTGQTITIGRGPIFGATTVLGPNGHIDGGTLALGRGPITWNNGDLSNVRVEGRLELSAPDARVYFAGGVTLTRWGGAGRGAIDLTGAGAILDFLDSQSLDDTTITVGRSGSANGIDFFTVFAEPHTLTFGAGMRIVATVANSTVTLGERFGRPDTTIVNGGLIWAGANGGSFTVDVATFTNTGQIRVDDGDSFTVRGSLNGSGAITVSGRASLELAAASADQTIVFQDGAGTLKLDFSLQFAAAVRGFQSGDAIDLIHIGATSLTLDAQDRLIVKDHAVVVATIQLVGAYAEGDFAFAGDGAGGTIITTSATPSSIGRPPVQAMAQAMAGISPHSDGMAAFAGAHGPAPRAWLPSLVHASGAAFQSG